MNQEEMKTVVGVLLMLLQVSHGVERFCDGRQNQSQCFGALGGAVDIQLQDSVSGIRSLQWNKNQSVIYRWTKTTGQTTKESRFFFFPSNGTVRINDLNRNESGEYKVEMHDHNGKETAQIIFKLFVQVPVSSVQLVSECLSQGQMKVSCLSEGDSPQYSWTLDGHRLTDSELFSRNNETNIIILRQNLRGHLVCSVKNQISNSSKGMNLSRCGFIFINCTSNGTQIAKWVYEGNNTLCVEPTVPTTVKYSEGKTTQTMTNSTTYNPGSNDPPWYIRLLPVMLGVLAALIIVLVISIGIICAHKKQKNTKAVEEDDQEMTYADVRIVKKPERKVEMSAEADVEYGQVKFSNRPKSRPNQSNLTLDDTVYAQVRKGR